MCTFLAVHLQQPWYNALLMVESMAPAVRQLTRFCAHKKRKGQAVGCSALYYDSALTFREDIAELPEGASVYGCAPT